MVNDDDNFLSFYTAMFDLLRIIEICGINSSQLVYAGVRLPPNRRCSGRPASEKEPIMDGVSIRLASLRV